MFKKLLSFLLCLILLTVTFSGCKKKAEKREKLSIVASIFPIYDWTCNIAGDHASVSLLLNKGTDLHSYQPTADDIIKVSTCDLFVYVGGESDKWAEDILKEAVNKNMATVNLLEMLGEDVKEEEIVEGMQTDEEDGETEYDEHVWLSLKNAQKLCRYISEKLCEIDRKNKEDYTAGAAAYLEKLNALDTQYQEAVNAAKIKTLLFGDRFPFRYLTEDYGLDYYAAFAGCSAESEASFETIIFLANKIDTLGIRAILQIESSDGKIAKTIKNATKTKDQTILTLNSMQSMTAKNGANYFSVMENNLEVLKNALQ